jgi:copper chaperone CopZ
MAYNSRNIAKWLIPAILLVASSSLPAAPSTKPSKPPPPARQPTGPIQAVHRIHGLFSPDREADLRVALEKVPGVKLISFDFDHAEGTFTYDPAEAFPGTKPDKIVERFDQLLRQASNGLFSVKPLCTTPHEKLKRIEIRIAGLDCKACSLAVYEILMKQDGVEQATASFHHGLATALIDPEKTSKEKLEAALKAREVPLKQKEETPQK